MRILKSLKPYEEIAITGCPYDNYQRIKSFSPILYSAKKGECLLVTLTIPDTWCDRAGDGAWFAIKVDNVVVARGLYSCGIDSQRVPITLQAVIEVQSDHDYQIEAAWCNFEKTGTCHIGRLGDTILTVIVSDVVKPSTPGHPVIF